MKKMIRHEFEMEVGPDDIMVEIVADIDPGEPARLTGHPDDMHPGEAPDWSYEIFLDGEITSWKWIQKNVTDADHLEIDRRIGKFAAGLVAR